MRSLFISIFVFCFLPSLCQAQDSVVDNTINITAEDYSFQAPDEIPSGWTKIRYTNEGEEPHFLFTALLPDGKTFNDYSSNVVRPFMDVWYALRDDGISQEKAMEKLGADLPDWYWTLQFSGGTGIVPPGQTTEVILNLEPGSYVLECYMKTEDGEFHSMEGMLRELTVTDKSSDLSTPESDIDITLSNFEMAIDGDLSTGKHMVAVKVKEHPEVGFGHNVHVSRLEPDTDIDNLVRWMNFLEIDGLQMPSPAKFLGGMHILPEGGTGYFTLDLDPGRYLFVSETTGHQGVMQEVVVE